MHLARVLIADAPTPQVALERDGCLYDVEALEEHFDTRFSPERFANAGDFQKRVIALGCAGLEELDARLRAAERPTEARLAKGAFVWCPPFAADRAMFVELDGSGDDAELRYRIANPRAVAGHESSLTFAAAETRAEVRLDVAVVLRDDLVRATPAEARSAILGLAILAAWTGLDELDQARAANRGRGASRDRAAQLGPILVTTEELESMPTRRVQLRLDDRVVSESTIAIDLAAIGASLAALSRTIELHAGDLVGIGLDLARRIVPFGARADLLIERVGRLSGRPLAST